MINHPVRKSMRLSGYDYSLASIYFVTLCTHHNQRLFGGIEEGSMHLNWGGRAIKQAWESMPEVVPDMLLDIYAIMPDHFHAIFGFAHEGPSDASKKVTDLPNIIRRFKTYSMHLYGEQVAAGRIDADLEKHREYIYNNALKKYILGD